MQRLWPGVTGFMKIANFCVLFLFSSFKSSMREARVFLWYKLGRFLSVNMFLPGVIWDIPEGNCFGSLLYCFFFPPSGFEFVMIPMDRCRPAFVEACVFVRLTSKDAYVILLWNGGKCLHSICDCDESWGLRLFVRWADFFFPWVITNAYVEEMQEHYSWVNVLCDHLDTK